MLNNITTFSILLCGLLMDVKEAVVVKISLQGTLDQLFDVPRVGDVSLFISRQLLEPITLVVLVVMLHPVSQANPTKLE
jgi:hypothetical protein